MDLTAFFKASYGLYVVSATSGEKDCGCIINTFMQVTAIPEQVIIAVHKENFTCQTIAETGVFAVSVLAQTASMPLIGRFGFRSSRDIEKFDGVASEVDENGVRYLTESVVARFSCRVVSQMDVGTHLIFLGKAEQAENLTQEEPLTYAYYHQVKNGKTPPKASSFQADTPKKAAEKKTFRCSVCGHTVEADSLPEDYICPICKQGRDKFVEVTEA